MTLLELVNTIEFDEVLSVLQREWDVDDSCDSYRSAYEALRTIIPVAKQPRESIKVEWCAREKPYLMASNVCGRAWNENANKEVIVSSNVSPVEAAAACLWEQTFWGYSPDIQERQIQFMVEDAEYQIAHGLTTTVDLKDFDRLLNDDYNPFDPVEEVKWEQWREQRKRELKLS